MGVRFVETRSGYVRAGLPCEGNGNHLGTVYAGVTFTLVEVVGGAMHWATSDVTTHYPFVRGKTIDVLAPGRGPLSASAALDDSTVTRIREEGGSDRKAPFEVRAAVLAEDGTLVARTVGD